MQTAVTLYQQEMYVRAWILMIVRVSLEMPKALVTPAGAGKFGYSMAFSSDAVYLAVSELPLVVMRVS